MAPDYERVMPHALARPIKLTYHAQTVECDPMPLCPDSGDHVVPYKGPLFRERFESQTARPARPTKS
jgi:hypothetical protein